MWVRVANSSTTRQTRSTRDASRPASSGAAISSRSAHRMLKSSRTAEVRDSGGIPARARLDPRSEAKASSPSRAVSSGPLRSPWMSRRNVSRAVSRISGTVTWLSPYSGICRTRAVKVWARMSRRPSSWSTSSLQRTSAPGDSKLCILTF